MKMIKGTVLTQKNHFNTEVLYINILIVLLIIMMGVVGYVTLENERESIRVEVSNTVSEFNTRIKTAAGSILSLHAAVEEINKNSALSEALVQQVHEINAQGDFVLDIPEYKGIKLANLTGFGGLDKSKKVRHEMATSLALTKYFAIVKRLNASAVRVYYASKNNFSTSYPYVWHDQFMWSADMLEHPQWRYATPELNEGRGLFFTPLHKCLRKEKMLLTVGKPVYEGDTFMGTVNMDLDTAAESAFLDTKNLHEGSYAIVNEKGEVVAASKLQGYANSVINQAKSLIAPEILGLQSVDKEYSEGDTLVYVRPIENTQWKLYYIKNKLDLYLSALIYIGMIFIVIVLLFRVKTLIKRLSASRDELERQALTDPMTKLYNRRYLAEITDHMLGLMRRSSSKLSAIMLDIDKFKNVNDTYGHQVGDDVIIKLAETLKSLTRKSDVICRLGGEEFLILLPETGIEGAEDVAENIRKAVEALVLHIGDSVDLRFTVSSGISEVREDEENFDAAMSRADTALYEAKEGGRNQVRIAKEDIEKQG